MNAGRFPGGKPRFMQSDSTENIFDLVPEVEISEGLEELLTIDEVAALLKVPKSWIYERTRRRGAERLPYIKLGKYLRFEEKEIRDYL